MGQVLLFSLTALANPTLVAAVTVILLLPSAEKLMLGYLVGAMVSSVTLGLVIVFAFEGSSLVKGAKHTANPIADTVLGAILLVISLVLATGTDKRLAKRHARRGADKRDKPPPRWRRALAKGDPKIAFVVGALLTLPGALPGRTRRHHQAPSANARRQPARPPGQRDHAGRARAPADRIRRCAGLDANND